jgi:dTDP-4-dehydrorhamnose 3,5-epimerase
MLRSVEDENGAIVKSYDQNEFQSRCLPFQLFEEYHWFCRMKGTIRGLHFQLEPYAQSKLIRVLRGSILNVGVDIRPGSETYGRHMQAALSAEDRRQLFVPRGFAHGFCTLESNVEILIKADAPSTPDKVRGILWNDPDIGIEWPIDADKQTVSDSDRRLPRLKDVGGNVRSETMPLWMACEDYPTFAYLLAQEKSTEAQPR